jgi:hypothetical protein
MTEFRWYEAVLKPFAVVTPRDGEEAPEPLTPRQQLAKRLGIPDARQLGDQRPTLVYFHWPHDDERNGDLSEKLCRRVLDDEDVARWGLRFRCVQVDMSQADVDMARELGAGSRPSLVIVDDDPEVAVDLGTPKTARRLAKGLERALKKFPDRWTELKKDLKDADRRFEKASDLADDDETLKDALALLRSILASDARVSGTYDRALSLRYTLQTRLEQSLR